MQEWQPLQAEGEQAGHEARERRVALHQRASAVEIGVGEHLVQLELLELPQRRVVARVAEATPTIASDVPPVGTSVASAKASDSADTSQDSRSSRAACTRSRTTPARMDPGGMNMFACVSATDGNVRVISGA